MDETDNKKGTKCAAQSDQDVEIPHVVEERHSKVDFFFELSSVCGSIWSGKMCMHICIARELQLGMDGGGGIYAAWGSI